MSALARILLSRGHQVSGSDRKMSAAMEALQSLGMVAFASQTANNFDELKKRDFSTPLVMGAIEQCGRGWSLLVSRRV